MLLKCNHVISHRQTYKVKVRASPSSLEGDIVLSACLFSKTESKLKAFLVHTLGGRGLWTPYIGKIFSLKCSKLIFQL